MSGQTAPAGLAAAGTADGRRLVGRPDPWKLAFFIVLALAVMAAVGWALLGSTALVVRHVRVTGTSLVSAAEIRRAAAIKLGVPLLTLNTGAAAARVERIGPVLSAQVTRSWPDTVVITVQQRTAALAVPAAGGYDLVDMHGITVRWAAHRPAGMALLTQPPAVLRGSRAVRGAVLVLRQLPHALRAELRSVSATATGAVTLHLRGGITVVWGGPGQADRKLAELALLLPTHARYYDVSDPQTAVTQG